MIRSIATLGVATAFLALGATASLAIAGGVDIGNVDIRALEPPIDVTPDQLAARGTPLYPPPPYDVAPLYQAARSIARAATTIAPIRVGRWTKRPPVRAADLPA
jgi:hypothetical protein